MDESAAFALAVGRYLLRPRYCVGHRTKRGRFSYEQCDIARTCWSEPAIILEADKEGSPRVNGSILAGEAGNVYSLDPLDACGKGDQALVCRRFVHVDPRSIARVESTDCCFTSYCKGPELP